MTYELEVIFKDGKRENLFVDECELKDMHNEMQNETPFLCFTLDDLSVQYFRKDDISILKYEQRR